MDETLRLMAVVAHPDDESLAFGGTLVKYAAEGAEVSIVMATRGEHGWPGDDGTAPEPGLLGSLREQEAREASRFLGAQHLVFLDFEDGTLADQRDTVLTSAIEREIRRLRPQVVLTFGPDGAYGHPDHIAVSRCTAAAVLQAAGGATSRFDRLAPHVVDKLYYRIWTEPESLAYREAIGDTVIDVEGNRRSWFSYPEWAVSTRLDVSLYWPNVWAAARCHRTQLVRRAEIDQFTNRQHEQVWGRQDFYRAYSTVDVDSSLEQDLFDGLRTGIQREVVLAA
jgi:LmbE family N-acetylglucosaminyl deacetylase